MKKVLTFIIIFFHSTTAIAQEAPSCPNGGSDPSQFCLPGMTWDNESKKCVTLVWLLLPNLLIYLRFFQSGTPYAVIKYDHKVGCCYNSKITLYPTKVTLFYKLNHFLSFGNCPSLFSHFNDFWFIHHSSHVLQRRNVHHWPNLIFVTPFMSISEKLHLVFLSKFFIFKH